MAVLRDSLPRGCADVIEGAWCIGCGACALACPHERVAMQLTAEGAWEPRVAGECPAGCVACARVCPFSLQRTSDAGEIAARLFGDAAEESAYLGRYDELVVGSVKATAARRDAASGGLGTWLSSELLRTGLVEAVVTAGPLSRHDDVAVTAGYRVCRAPGEVVSCAGSHYCPVTLADALAAATAECTRVAVVAVPCVARAVRLLQIARGPIRERVVAVIGLTCGQSKTWGFTRAATDALGVGWDEVAAVRYRRKTDEAPATRWLLEATRIDGERVAGRYPIDVWRDRAFTPGACEACDDVFAECADVTLMDAWAQPYIADPRGTTIAIVRTPAMARLLADGVVRGELELAPVGRTVVLAAQAGVIAEKRDGLAYRLALWSERGVAAPHVRVAADRRAGGIVSRAMWRAEMTIAEETRVAPWSAATEALARVRGARRILALLRRMRNLEIRITGGAR